MTTYNYQQSTELPKLLYIMGTARSGSTILEILLSAPPNNFGAGELTHLPRDGFILDKTCACQLSTSRCTIWSKVKDKLHLDTEKLATLDLLHRKIDRHAGLLRQLLKISGKKELNTYLNYNRQLLHAIKDATECEVIIDSSKYAGRAYALSRELETEVLVICLTRSPSGLIDAFQKNNKHEQLPKSITQAAIYYMVTTTLLWLFYLKSQNKPLLIRFEDLMASPIPTIEKIQEWADIDLSDTINRLRTQASFSPGHIVTGNRLRNNREIFFKNKIHQSLPKGAMANCIICIMEWWKRRLKL